MTTISTGSLRLQRCCCKCCSSGTMIISKPGPPPSTARDGSSHMRAFQVGRHREYFRDRRCIHPHLFHQAGDAARMQHWQTVRRNRPIPTARPLYAMQLAHPSSLSATHSARPGPMLEHDDPDSSEYGHLTTPSGRYPVPTALTTKGCTSDDRIDSLKTTKMTTNRPAIRPPNTIITHHRSPRTAQGAYATRPARGPRPAGPRAPHATAIAPTAADGSTLRPQHRRASKPPLMARLPSGGESIYPHSHALSPQRSLLFTLLTVSG